MIMPDEQSGLDKVDEVLNDLNTTIGAVIPLVGTVGAVARLVIGVARNMGQDTKDFEEEIARLDANLAAADAATAEFRAKYGR